MIHGPEARAAVAVVATGAAVVATVARRSVELLHADAASASAAVVQMIDRRVMGASWTVGRVAAHADGNGRVLRGVSPSSASCKAGL